MYLHGDIGVLASTVRMLTVAVASIFMAAAATADTDTSVRKLFFEEEWRLVDTNPEYLVGVPADVCVVGDNLMVLDRQLRTVWVFDRQGEFQGSFGQPGEGPGDFSTPIKLVALGDSAVGVLDRAPGRLHVFELNGDLVSSQRIHGSATQVVGYNVKGSSEFMVLLRGEVEPTTVGKSRGTASWNSLVKFYTDGRCGALFHEKLCEFSYDGVTIPPVEEEQYVLSGYAVAGSTLYVAPFREQYAILKVGMSGEPIKSLWKDIPPRKRTKAEREEIHEERSVSVGGCLVMDYREAQYDQTIVGMRAHGDNLWVLSVYGSRDPGEGVYQVWDVFDGQGNEQESVQIVVDADPDQDKIFWLSETTAVVCKNFQDAEDAFFNRGDSETDHLPVSLVEGIELQMVFMRGRWDSPVQLMEPVPMEGLIDSPMPDSLECPDGPKI